MTTTDINTAINYVHNIIDAMPVDDKAKFFNLIKSIFTMLGDVGDTSSNYLINKCINNQTLFDFVVELINRTRRLNDADNELIRGLFPEHYDDVIQYVRNIILMNHIGQSFANKTNDGKDELFISRIVGGLKRKIEKVVGINMGMWNELDNVNNNKRVKDYMLSFINAFRYAMVEDLTTDQYNEIYDIFDEFTTKNPKDSM